ncbi:DUF4910 domain-containing protein [Acetobacter sp. TBRC 12305]|uniref:DUF4910 domain-containing protein n=1 Tax=Acetobacter garciniae TaxID=2817435 RepID=A0A939HMB0_9PROT|nr:DUF4910 domain-containing protein [Acetobacter garciniae]MBO1325500.1 DUF4910 domain-containing protein [Acetobacter garciniae]MBX0345328.1 DUF4910 domain-containing protein [Acetobacter garciniae]
MTICAFPLAIPGAPSGGKPDQLHDHARRLFPICRSITGEGIRQTLSYIGEYIDNFHIHHIGSGTQVFDWQVPLEWNVRTARICRTNGEVVIDFAQSNLHLVQYSTPMRARVSRDVLQEHLYSLPDQPDLIPYRTSYYNESWGFCVSEHQRAALTDAEYDIEIDTDLRPGVLSYGEVRIPGKQADEVLFSVHCCHPSLANDNLSSIAIAIELVRALQAGPARRLSYRFVFIPGTIGAITWLAINRNTVDRIRHGLVLSCLGDEAPPTYKQSRQGDAPVDRYAAYLLSRWPGAQIVPFEPYGYDERQYCSPGFNLPVGCLMRSRNGTFAQYHTSADNLDFITPAALAGSYRMIANMIAMMEADTTLTSLNPFCEPQLGRRGLYKVIGGTNTTEAEPGHAIDQMTLLWVLNLADGTHSLLDIADRSGKPFGAVMAATHALSKAGLVRANAD